MTDPLKPLDPQEVAETLSKPPFVQVSGVINIRDLGNLPSASYPPQRTKPHYMYRSAELSSITDEGRFLSLCPRAFVMFMSREGSA